MPGRAALLAGALIIMTGGLPAGETAPLVRMLPEKTPLYVRMTPAVFRERLPAIGRIPDDPRMRDALEPLLQTLRGIEGLAALETGVTLSLIFQRMPGAIELALLPALPNAPGLRAAFYLDIGPGAENLRAALPRVEAHLRAMGTVTRRVVGGTAVTVTENGPWHLEFALDDGRLYGGIGLGVMEALFSDLDSTPEASLATNETFRALSAAAQAAAAGMCVFVRPAPWLSPAMPEGLRPLCPEALLWSTAPDGDGLRDMVAISRVDTAPGDTQLANDGAGHLADYLPADCDDAVFLRIPLSQVWGAFLTTGVQMARAGVEDDRKRFEAALLAIAEFEKESGLQFAALLAGIGPEMALGWGPSGLVFAADIRDAATLDAWITALDARLGGMRLRRAFYRGHPLVYANRTGRPLPYAPCIALVDDHTLVAALWPHRVKEQLGLMADGAWRPLSGDADFAAARGREGGGAVFRYARMTGRMRRGYETAAAGLFLTSANRMPFDAGKAPTADVMLPATSGLSTRIDTAPGAIVIDCRGPAGIWSDVATILDAAAAAVHSPMGWSVWPRLAPVLGNALADRPDTGGAQP